MCWATQPPQVPKCRHGGCRHSGLGADSSFGRPSPSAPSAVISSSAASVVTHCPQQELLVAGAAGDGRGDDALHAPAGLRGEPVAHDVYGALTGGGITHDAALADGGPARFELGLDKGYQPHA